MATKDTNSGLLTKMARFVRNPTKDWTESAPPAAEPEAPYSKQALKAMIERKRQNDFVRRREFDYLRKLRRNGPSVSPDMANRPSIFQNSIESNMNERASTLRKIDEIEAQMSKQWWRGKHDEVVVNAGKAAVPDFSPRIGDTDTTTYAPTQAVGLNAELDSRHSSDYEPTQMGLPPSSGLEALGTMPQPEASVPGRAAATEAGISEFSSSKLFSVELGAGLADPDMEEAAIRFANADDAGAEAGLLDALKADNVSPDLADGWASALFDLYRGTGQQTSFDRVAIDYAQRFGRSAPAWFSTPDLLGRKAASEAPVKAAPSFQSGQIVWDCPAMLDWHALQTLLASPPNAATRYQLDWSRLITIAPEAAKVLATLFAEWCSKPVKLQFEGVEVLEKTLKYMTPSGDQQVDSF
jgi:hypothetical protein